MSTLTWHIYKYKNISMGHKFLLFHISSYFKGAITLHGLWVQIIIVKNFPFL